ncbi:DUF3800 domain-containing protein [Clostridium tertium]|uniref:DUF3800 domain-containing protein n=1 Tax=Clostridium tertium TaxID=1559 RepID=UPI002A7F4AC6|nr:DUF3800 domain-containing protein [Clostridium tertium]MDY4606208.1 DUF3800 domain-containing protein [Clostridium tertium]
MVNIYCDESCHLEKDNSDVMLLGALSCESEYKDMICQDIRNIKRKYIKDSKIEVKWTKVSNSKIDLYKELIDYFFGSEYLHFRIVVATGKKSLNHIKYNNGNQNEWYYKMYYLLLDKMCDVDSTCRIFIDVKDTNGGPTIRKLHNVLCANRYDYKKDIIKGIDQVNSERVDLMQIADILIGAIGFYHRGLYNNKNNSLAKKELVDHLIKYINKSSIKNGTSRFERKFNIFIWEPNYYGGN